MHQIENLDCLALNVYIQTLDNCINAVCGAFSELQQKHMMANFAKKKKKKKKNEGCKY